VCFAELGQNVHNHNNCAQISGGDQTHGQGSALRSSWWQSVIVSPFEATHGIGGGGKTPARHEGLQQMFGLVCLKKNQGRSIISSSTVLSL
jgi:hypothetical protein